MPRWLYARLASWIRERRFLSIALRYIDSITCHIWPAASLLFRLGRCLHAPHVSGQSVHRGTQNRFSVFNYRIYRAYKNIFKKSLFCRFFFVYLIHPVGTEHDFCKKAGFFREQEKMERAGLQSGQWCPNDPYGLRDSEVKSSGVPFKQEIERYRFDGHFFLRGVTEVFTRLFCFIYSFIHFFFNPFREITATLQQL